MTFFRSDIEGSVLRQHQGDLHVVVNNYDEVLRSLLDKHVPVTEERVVTFCPSAPWYTDGNTAEKKKRRRLELKKKASALINSAERVTDQVLTMSSTHDFQLLLR